MEDENLSDAIRRARKEMPPPEEDRESTLSTINFEHSSFDKGCRGAKRRHRRKKKRAASFTTTDRWAESQLRVHGSVRDRTIMAVRDAAKMAQSKKTDPYSNQFYVGKAIAKGWNLDAQQLYRGLSALEKIGMIVIRERRKGRYARIGPLLMEPGQQDTIDMTVEEDAAAKPEESETTLMQPCPSKETGVPSRPKPSTTKITL